MFSTTEILDIAIQLEQNGEDAYQRALAAFPKHPLQATLKWMAEEEAKHAEWFRAQKLKAPEEAMPLLVAEINQQLLRDLLEGQSFSLKDADFSKLEQIDPLIDLFIELEKDTIIFYEMLEPFLENEDAKTQLAQIIAEERRHIEQLHDFRLQQSAEALREE